jgi:hypothetical protein
MRISDLSVQFVIRNSQSAINSVNGWPTPAALCYESNADFKRLALNNLPVSEAKLRAVAGHVFQFHFSLADPLAPFQAVTSTLLAPSFP